MSKRGQDAVDDLELVYAAESNREGLKFGGNSREKSEQKLYKIQIRSGLGQHDMIDGTNVRISKFELQLRNIQLLTTHK